MPLVGGPWLEAALAGPDVDSGQLLSEAVRKTSLSLRLAILRRAAHELYVWSKCQHPNILELTGVAVFHGQIAMVSPWMERGTVTWYISQNPQSNRYTLCTQIGEGVVYLHKNDVVHGDLKGANILISNDGTPKITDFGTASMSKYTLKFDRTSGLPGMTLRWAAPELFDDVPEHTTQADVYALGMTYLEIITGSEPYSGISERAITLKIVNGILPARPTEYMPNGDILHDRMWLLLEACWTFNSQDRPTSTQVLDWVKSLAQQEPNYESISDVLYFLGTLGYMNCTGTLERSSIAPIKGEDVDYDSYEAVQRALIGRGRSYKFKCPKDSYFKDRRIGLRYAVRSLYIWSKCEHPNILKLFGVAKYRESLALIYPPSIQGNYAHYLSSRFTPDRLRLCIPVVDAVSYLHRQGIIHGNITYGTFLVSEDGVPLLEDFGNGALVSSDSLFSRDPLLEPYYRQSPDAPERFSYQKVPTREVDVWTLGTVMGIIATGCSFSELGIERGPEYTPMPEQPTVEILQNPRGERFWALIRACRCLEPKDRPTADKVLADLKAIADMP